jgi:pyruvate/2-oxoglutarate dehydrogenase complex dihydrolipoamide dehydrogenase (E3) component
VSLPVVDDHAVSAAADSHSDSLTPPRRPVWDLLVVGGGTAGLVAAKTAAGFGADVLLVERARTGGDCLWAGCVPSKALLAAAHAAADARAAVRYGIHVGGVTVDFPAVMDHVRAAIAAIEPTDSPAALRAAGVRVVHAEAHLTGPSTVRISGAEVPFRQLLLATGSAPTLPPIPGLNKAQPLTSDTVWELGELPNRLVVLGGGSIGCELGQAFARLGSTVTIVEAVPRLLFREDADAAEVVTAALRSDGVRVVTDAAATAVHPAGSAGAGSIVLTDGERIGYDRLLVAVGRAPRTKDLGLDAAGVATDERGYVRVNARLRTSNPRIWAAGDVTGHPQFTHTAGVHGNVAASNAILGLRRSVDVATIPRVTYTQPEVAAVGVGADQADASRGLTARTVSHDDVDRAIAEGHVNGFTRLILDHRGRIVGATVVGPRAGETLGELVLAASRGLRTRDLAAAMHPYPTYNDGPWKAAIADAQHRLTTRTPATTIRTLAATRRAWLSRPGR